MTEVHEPADSRAGDETIVAISTPHGRGGIGIVRLSGARALEIATLGLRTRSGCVPRRATLAQILDAAGAVLDEGLVTWFPAPHSYTGEEVVEIAAHGSPVLLAAVVEAAVRNGARLAEAGEFTERAFLSGRIDLTQAEAVQDLIAARTLEQARTAAAQLGGALSHVISPVKQQLLHLVAALEAGTDFAEDDLDTVPAGHIAAELVSLLAALQPLARSVSYGRLLREGVRLAIVGQPNAGKSSLFNRLLQQDRAIVTPLPGTTRDTLHQTLSLDGIPVELVDTAGLREIAETPETAAEREGIRRSRETMAEADLVLHVVDVATLSSEGGLCASDAAIRSATRGRPSLLLLNKCDMQVQQQGSKEAGIRISALTGLGFEELRARISSSLKAQPPAEPAVITNLRQSRALEEAMTSLEDARLAAANGTPHEFLLLDLHAALEALDQLTGQTTPDDVLRLIFASFCIGK